MYKGLKEPIDMVGGMLKKGFLAIVGMFRGASESGQEIITYG